MGGRSRNGLRLGMGDDAALWRPRPGFETILTTDWFLEGSHFLRRQHPPDSVGWKCLARAVSDIAAMGGAPRCFLLSLALPGSLAESWLDGFLVGLRRAARSLDCPLAGGDTTRRDEILINVTVIGEARPKDALLRSGAREGDYIYVSGRLGEAELGLRLLRDGRSKSLARSAALRKHLYPAPRLELAAWLAANHKATSLIDISDGLSTDLRRLCDASGVGAYLGEDDIPCVRIPEELAEGIGSPLQLALHGGDDYELLFTAPRGRLPARPWKFRGLRISPIGVIVGGNRIVCYDPNTQSGYELKPGGWDPFRKRAGAPESGDSPKRD